MSGRVLEIAEYVLSNIMENVVGANIRKFCVLSNMMEYIVGANIRKFSCVVNGRRAVYNAQIFMFLAAGRVGGRL